MWPALLIIAASAFLKHQANQDASERRDAFRRSMESYQRTKAAESGAATEDLLKKQTPDARGGELQQVTADREQSLKDTVGAAQAFGAAPVAGKMSGDYAATQEANAGRIAERTRRAIEQLATMGAPGEQQQAFGRRFGLAAGKVDAANRASENVGRGYLSDISNVHPDPFLSMAGDVGMNVGGAMAGGAAGGGGGAQPNLVSPNNVDWGSLDAGPGAYSASKATPLSQKLKSAFSLWGTS